MKRTRWLLCLLFSLLLTLSSGCGDDDAKTTTVADTTAADTTAADTTAADTTAADTTAADTTATDTGDATEEILLSIDGLSAPVTAVYDEHGVLHLTCQTDADCSAALGYFHAANRFFLMDFVRRFMRGQLGSMVMLGDTILEQDYLNRLRMTDSTGMPLEDKIIAQATPAALELLDAYSMGINAWLADAHAGRNGATFTAEYRFPAMAPTDTIREWEPEDSAAFVLYMIDDLSNSSADEIAIGEDSPKLDPDFAQDLYSFYSALESFTMPASGETYTQNKSKGDRSRLELALDTIHPRLAKSSALLHDAREKLDKLYYPFTSPDRDSRGSNNWLVGPSRTTSGHAILANDPHLSLTNPAIFFPVEWDAVSEGTGKIHVAGGSLAGIPACPTGHNEHIAWGVTTIYYDLTDVYLEELNAAGDAVIFNGAEVPMTVKSFDFLDSSTGETVTKSFKWVPHHGPVLAEDLVAGTAVSFRWSAAEGATELQAFFDLNAATSIDEARTALLQITSSNQNFVVASTAGEIAWFPFSKVPVRSWDWGVNPPWMPLPGDGSAEWSGFHDFDDLPQMRDPARAFIATANQDITGAGADGDPSEFSVLQAINKGLGIRMARIVELIEANESAHTVDTMLAIQSDTRSLLGENLTPFLLDNTDRASLSVNAARIYDALDAWSYTCPTGLTSTDPTSALTSDAAEQAEAAGCLAFHATLFAFQRAAYADDLFALTGDREDTSPIRGFESKLTRLMMLTVNRPEVLENSVGYWDDLTTVGAVETLPEIAAAAMTDAGDALAAEHGEDASQWAWGRTHTLTLRSIFDSFGVPSYNSDAFANDGGLYTVDVANVGDRGLDFYHTNGASIRTVIDMAPEGPQMKLQLPGGVDLHRTSPGYNNFFEGWLTNTPIDFHFGPGAVTDPMSTLVIQPK